MNKNILKEIREHILKIANTQRADSNKLFFKTGIGEYGEGDKFIGITVPKTRKLAKAFDYIDLKDTERLLKSEFHEERLMALFIFINKFKKADKKLKEEIFNITFKNIKYINNWDLVDTFAPNISGEFIKEKYSLNTKNCSGVKFLLSLVSDKNVFAKNQKEKLWEKRIGIVSTSTLLRKSFDIKKYKGQKLFAKEIIFELVKKNLNEKDELNKHDLLQKACGWMLREYAKNVNEKNMLKFLEDNFDKIKSRRVLLRYAIERLSREERNKYLLRK